MGWSKWGWLDGKLVVHADNDQLVPPAGAERIYPASAVRRDACKVYLPTDLVHQHLAGTLPREVEVLHVLDGHETSAGTHKVERGRRKKNSAYVTPPAYAALQTTSGSPGATGGTHRTTHCGNRRSTGTNS